MHYMKPQESSSATYLEDAKDGNCGDVRVTGKCGDVS